MQVSDKTTITPRVGAVLKFVPKPGRESVFFKPSENKITLIKDGKAWVNGVAYILETFWLAWNYDDYNIYYEDEFNRHKQRMINCK